MSKLTRMQGVSGSIRSQVELQRFDERTYDVLDNENKWLKNLKKQKSKSSRSKKIDYAGYIRID